MAGEDARLKAGLKAAEDELNLIKNQIQQTLLDIREHILDVTNPFNSVDAGMLDDDEEVIEEGGLGGGGVSESMGAGDAGGGDAGDEAEEALGEEDAPLDEEDLLGDDDGFEEELEDDLPEDDLLGGGDSGGLSDLLSAEDELEEEPEEDFQFDDEEDEVDEDSTDEEEEDEELPEDSDMRDDEYEQPGDAVGGAIAAALGANVDLLTLASLVRWTAITRDRLGANRLDILLDAYEMAGRISPQMKNVIKTISAIGDEEADGSIPVRDIVTAMVRMEGVLNSGGQARESNRLLGLLLEMDDDPLDRLIA